MGNKTLDTTPLMGLFLILLLMVVVLCGPSQGLSVKVANSCDDGGDQQLVVLKLSRNHGLTRMPDDHLSFHEIGARLDKIFERNSERVVFVEGDMDIPFQEVVDAIEAAQKHVNYVAILTPSVANEPLMHICVMRDIPVQQNMPGIKLEYVPLWPWW